MYSFDAEYVFWHDWDWIDERLDKISRDEREQKRWMLLSQAAAASLGFAGNEDMFDTLWDSTFTKEEKRQMAEDEERRQMEMLEEQRRERLKSMGLMTA